MTISDKNLIIDFNKINSCKIIILQGLEKK